jgi:hypothetical protein
MLRMQQVTESSHCDSRTPTGGISFFEGAKGEQLRTWKLEQIINCGKRIPSS